MLQQTIDLIKRERHTSSKHAAQVLGSKGIAEVAPSTLRRHLHKNKMAYGHAKKGLQLTALQKRKRVSFAKHHIQENADWSKVMFTDSKIFCSDKVGSRVWYQKGSQPSACLPKHTIKVHAYLAPLPCATCDKNRG